MFRSWNVISGNLYSLDDTYFSPGTVRLMGKEAQEAIRVLTEKVLDTQVGNRLAKEVYQKSGRLFTAVAFNEKNGLVLRLNGDEHQIASKDDVYSGKVPGFAEIQKIQAVLERQGFITVKETDLKAREVFREVMQQRGGEVESPLQEAQVKVLGDKEDSCVEKISKLVAAWKVILFVTGLSIMSTAFHDMVAALTDQNHWEKFLLSCASFLEGMTTFGISVVSLMKEFSEIARNFIAKAAASAAFPVIGFTMYGAILLAAFYKFYIQLKFKHDLDAIVGDGTDPKRVKEAIIWLRQQTQISPLEMDQKAKEGPFVILNRKWEKFTLRVQEGMLSEILDPERLDNILQGKDEALSVINEVQKANNRALVWTSVSMVANLIGIVATLAYIGAFGHITAGVITTLYIFATIGGVLASPEARLEFFRWLHKKIDCAKSEDEGLEKDTVCSQTSSTTYEQSEGYPKILSMPIEETSSHSKAS